VTKTGGGVDQSLRLVTGGRGGVKKWPKMGHVDCERSLSWESRVPLDGTVGVIFSQNEGWGCFFLFFSGPLFLRNGSRYQNVPSK